jgi:hypothetical protein
LSRRALALALVFLTAVPCVFFGAEKTGIAPKGFTIKPSAEWMELPLPFQNVVVSYGKKGTLATFHITAREIDGSKTVDQLQWKDLFSPEFDSVDIRTENMTRLGGEKAKTCIYTLKPGEFKRVMEGKLPAKYINYVVIHNGKLYSITFKDTEDGFAATYPSFLSAIRTLQFDAANTQRQGKLT